MSLTPARVAATLWKLHGWPEWDVAYCAACAWLDVPHCGSSGRALTTMQRVKPRKPFTSQQIAAIETAYRRRKTGQR